MRVPFHMISAATFDLDNTFPEEATTRSSLRETASLLARDDADEFVTLVPETARSLGARFSRTGIGKPDVRVFSARCGRPRSVISEIPMIGDSW